MTTSDPKCACGAYAKPELRHRVTKALCCSWCFDLSYEDHGDEFEALMNPPSHDDHDLYAPPDWSAP